MKPQDGAQRWAQALASFEKIVDLDERSRGDHLRAMGAADPALRRSLEELLVGDAEAEVRLARIDLAFGSAAAVGTPHQRDADPLKLVGRTISHFHVIELVASGGMGVVYRAEDIRLRRRIALKFPLPSHHFDRNAKERFLREARLAGAFDHPNVCGIYEAGETDDGYLFYAMPLYEGETLKSRLAREGALPISDTLSIAKQIAHGLSAAHETGIVHRDLKPANVMLLPDGVVKILDFGLAKARDVSLSASRITLGTVSYMAPEQVRGHGVDGRADLWALGVVLYEMSTGRRPFQGEDDVTVSHAIVYDEPTHPSALRGEVKGPVEKVIRGLLRKQPAERYRSAADVAAALSAISIGAADRSGLSSFGATPGLPRLRVRARTAGLAAMVLFALAAGAWFLRGKSAAIAAPRTVAVLPFRDQSDGDESHYLAAGLSDAISSELRRINALVVPGHLSTSAYRSTSRPLREIAKELDVTAIVTGRVQRTGERVRVDAELFDAQADRRIWSKRYDGEVGKLLDIQRDATRAIVAALGVEMASAERALLDHPATTNSRAYDLYLRGRAVELGGLQTHLSGRIMPIENVHEAQSFYARARDLDPAFALARARLAQMLMLGAAAYDTTHARREQARLEAEAALRLHPGLPEAHSALAAYWGSGVGDLAKASEQLELAMHASPRSAELHLELGSLYLRMGRWEDAVVQFERTMQLDPRSAWAATQAAFTMLRLRRDVEAMRAFDRAIYLAPHEHMLKVIKGHTYLRWKGSADTLAAVLRSIPSEWDPDGMATWARYTVLRVERQDREALAMLARSRRALSRDGLVYQPIALMRAHSYDALGERAKAREQYEAARAVLADSVESHPADASMRVALGLAYAGLGRKADAIREARRAMKLVPLSQNSPGATAFMGGAIEVFGRAGELDEAFNLLELLLAMPAGREVTIPFLRVWPGFDPLRRDPRFQQQLERFAPD